MVKCRYKLKYSLPFSTDKIFTSVHQWLPISTIKIIKPFTHLDGNYGKEHTVHGARYLFIIRVTPFYRCRIWLTELLISWLITGLVQVSVWKLPTVWTVMWSELQLKTCVTIKAAQSLISFLAQRNLIVWLIHWGLSIDSTIVFLYSKVLKELRP